MYILVDNNIASHLIHLSSNVIDFDPSSPIGHQVSQTPTMEYYNNSLSTLIFWLTSCGEDGDCGTSTKPLVGDRSALQINMAYVNFVGE